MSDPAVRPTDPGLERRWRIVEAKLAANETRLAEQGSLAVMRSASGRRVLTLRFTDWVEGRRVRRSIYVGGVDQTELVRRTRVWLDHCRVRGRVAEEVAGFARLVSAASGVVRRLHPRLVPKWR